MNSLRKNRQNSMFAGVCSGLGRFFNVSPLIFRIAFVITGALPLYIVLALLLPEG